MAELLPFQKGKDPLEFWKDPKNAELVKNAVPLESVIVPTKLIDFIRDHFEDTKNDDIVEIFCHFFETVCLLWEEIIDDNKSTHVVSKIFSKHLTFEKTVEKTENKKYIRVLKPSEVQESIKLELEGVGIQLWADVVVLVEESTDKSGTGKEEGGVGRDKDGVGREEGGVGRDKGGVGRDEGGAGRDKGGVGRDEGGAGRDKGGVGRDKGGAGRDEGGAGRDKGEVGRDEGGAGKDEPRRGYATVNDENLNCVPYRSIGKLFWLRHRPVAGVIRAADISYYCTAFCIEQRTIVTVAHCFDLPPHTFSKIFPTLNKIRRRDVRNAYFVPAMKDRNDIYRYQDVFRVYDLKILFDYQPRDVLLHSRAQYDVCSAKIYNGSARILDPLPIRPFQSSKQLQWTIIGYGDHEANVNGKMIAITGSAYSVFYFGGSQVFLEVADVTPLRGMSGGPWIRFGMDEATGVQSGITTKGCNLVYSPFINLEKLQELGIGVSQEAQ